MHDMGSSRVWTRHSTIWAVMGLLLALTGIVWSLAALSAPFTDLLGGATTLLGLGLIGYGIARRPLATDVRVLSNAAGKLADSVARRAAEVLRGLLADRVGSGRPQAAQVRWRTATGDETGSLNTIDENGSRNTIDETGSLNTIADFFQRLPDSRLVVRGPAGSGKTVLALRALLDLIAALPEEPGMRLRVPVRLDLPEFEPGDGLDVAQVARRLDGWIAAHLVSAYRVRPAVARGLVQEGWILPILDGLDQLRQVDGRAVAAALRAPFILLGRDDAAAFPPATVVHLQPLSIEQVAAWLVYQFPDPTKPPGVEHRWLRVLRHLAAEPDGALATCLRSPIGLSLIVTAYRDPATTPDDLLALPPEDLEPHLRAHGATDGVAGHHRHA
jgi:hypothetical protein